MSPLYYKVGFKYRIRHSDSKTVLLLVLVVVLNGTRATVFNKRLLPSSVDLPDNLKCHINCPFILFNILIGKINNNRDSRLVTFMNRYIIIVTSNKVHTEVNVSSSEYVKMRVAQKSSTWYNLTLNMFIWYLCACRYILQ